MKETISSLVPRRKCKGGHALQPQQWTSRGKSCDGLLDRAGMMLNCKGNDISPFQRRLRSGTHVLFLERRRGDVLLTLS